MRPWSRGWQTSSATQNAEDVAGFYGGVELLLWLLIGVVWLAAFLWVQRSARTDRTETSRT